MDKVLRNYGYLALDPRGRRVKGQLRTSDEAEAFAQLRRLDLTPVSIRRLARERPPGEAKSSLRDRDLTEVLGHLADLLRAGADMRTALEILGGRSARPELKEAFQALIDDISRGDGLDEVFSRRLGRRGPFIGALVAAGETSGDLAGGLARAGEMIGSRVRLQSKLTSILAYPAFVLISTFAAILALLLFIVPTLAPLTEDLGAAPPPVLGILIVLSDLLRDQGASIALAAAILAVAALVAGRHGFLGPVLDRLLMTGPLRRIANSLVFGGFSMALGGMLAAGAPMSEALRLAIRSVGSPWARKRLEPVFDAVRQGEPLSTGLERVPGFPGAVVRLVAVGESTGAQGAMLSRGGKLEEETAIRRIESIGAMLGPVLIVGLGALIGLLMAGLLSGVSEIGGAVLR